MTSGQQVLDFGWHHFLSAVQSPEIPYVEGALHANQQVVPTMFAVHMMINAFSSCSPNLTRLVGT